MARKLEDAVAEAALALSPAASGARVLEVEAGLGALTLRLGRVVTHVTAVDASGAMVKALRARVAVARLKNVEARVADPAALPFPERTFDAAYFVSVGAPRDGVLAELRRVLKPGAPAVVAASERDALLEDLALAGFDDVVAHRVDRANAWVAIGIA
jgi:ubiquinone/menaquinone biosynthesis C-methylase UbiE